MSTASMKLLICLGMLVTCIKFGESQLNVGGVDASKLIQRALKCPDAIRGLSLTSVASLLGARTGVSYDNQLQDLGNELYPPIAGWSCLTRPLDPLTGILVPADAVKRQLNRCQRHLKYRVDSNDGCVYNVNAPYHDAWNNPGYVYLEDAFPSHGVHKKRERIRRVRDFSLPCGEKKSNMRKLVAVRERCRSLRYLLMNAACDGDKLRTATFRGDQIHDCIYDKIDDANIYITSGFVFSEQCITEEKRDC